MSASIYYHPVIINHSSTIRINGFDIFREHPSRQWVVARILPKTGEVAQRHEASSYRAAVKYAKTHLPADVISLPKAQVIHLKAS